MGVNATIEALNKTSGLRLFGYTILGTWVIGAVGSAIADIIHGNKALIEVVPPPEPSSKRLT